MNGQKISIFKAVLGTLTAVIASLAVPICLLLWVILAEPPSDPSDGYIRGAMGLMEELPGISLILLIYHSIAGILGFRVPAKIAFLIVLSLLACILFALVSQDAISTLFLWIILSVGTIFQYFIFGWNKQAGNITSSRS